MSWRNKKKSGTRTNQLTSDTLLMLQNMGFMAWRQNNNPTPIRQGGKIIGVRKMPEGSRKGVPDICAIHPVNGKFIGFEIKVDKDKMSADQIQFRDDLLKRNAHYYVIREIDDVINFLNDYRMSPLYEHRPR